LFRVLGGAQTRIQFVLAIALFVLIFGTVFAAFSGGDWRAALGGFVGVLMGAMNYHMPLLDWLYPPGDKQQGDD